MLSKEILETQEVVEMPAREMMDFVNFGNFARFHVDQSNTADQTNNLLGLNQAAQGNSAGVLNVQLQG